MLRSIRVHLRFLQLLVLFNTFLCVTHASTIRVPQDAATIQAALNIAAVGDTVLVSPGTYKENLKVTKDVHLISTDGPAKTIIDGSSGHTHVITGTFLSSFTTEISGFTVQGGGDPGITFTSAIELEASGVTFTNDVFANNIDRHIYGSASTVIVRDSTFYTSVPDGQYCRPPDGIRIFGSLANYNGNTAPTLIEHNTFIGNTTACTGSGVSGDASEFVIRNNLFQGTRYAVAMNPLKITFTQNIVTSGYGGALSISHYYGVYPLTDPTDFQITNNTFVDNLGSGLNVYTQNSVIYISLLIGKMLFANNIIKESSPTGTVIECDSSMPPLTPPEIAIESYTPPILDHNLVHAPAIPLIKGRGCSDPIGVDGNISGDPQLDASFKPRAGSPAIDAGNSSVNLEALDYLGNPRLQDGTGRGYPTVDIGAIELPGPSGTPINPLTLTASAYFMQPGTVTLKAQLKNPLLTGSIRFFQGSGSIALLNSDGSGSASTQQNLLPGLYEFTATYSPLAAAAPGVATPIYVYVTRYQTYLQVSTTPSGTALVGQAVTVHLKLGSLLGGVPTGPVTVSEGSRVLGTVTPDPTTGVADLPIGALTLGFHQLTATYGGSNLFDPATGSTTLNVVPLYVPSLSFTDSPSPSVVGLPVSLKAAVGPDAGVSVSSVPSGRVDFYDGSTLLGSASVSAGSAQISTATLAVGSHALTAKFVADYPYGDKTASLTHLVTLSPSSTSLSVSPNPVQALGTVTLSAHVSTTNGSLPTGTISFSEGSALIASGTLDSTGTATVSLNSLAAGTHLLVAYFAGDANNQASNSGPTTLQIQGVNTQTAITGPTSLFAFQSFQLNAHVAAIGPGIPAGNITFRAGARILGSALLDGSGNARISVALPAGNYSISGDYVGSGTYNASTSASIPITVAPDGTGLSLTASPTNQIQRRVVLLSATVGAAHSTANPIGTISLFDGTTLIASSAVDATGHAAFSISSLSVGQHILLASYSPASGDFLSSTSIGITVTISPSDFALITPAAFEVQAEHHVDITANIESIGDLSGPVHLSCANLPSHARCYFLHGEGANLTSGGKASVTIWFETSDVRGYKATLDGFSGKAQIAWALMAPALFLVGKRRRSAILRLTIFCWCFLGAASLLTGCSGLYPGYTPPGQYTFQIVADHPIVSHTNSVNVTVTN